MESDVTTANRTVRRRRSDAATAAGRKSALFQNVARAADRVDKLFLKRIVYLSAQTPHRHVDDVGVAVEVHVPHLIGYHGPGEHFSRTPHEQMGALYDRADIYLNSSNIDNMPLSILEAFAAGLPVVTTDAGGIPFVVRDRENGLMVPRDDHVAMAASIVRLLREPSLAARLASTARDECLSKYVWPAVRGEWERVYQAVDAQARGDRQAAALAMHA